MSTAIAPSKAHVWGECSGSIQLAPKYPDTQQTQTRREGVAAHWVCYVCLEQGGEPHDLVGYQDPDGTIISSEMAEHCSVFVDYVRGLAARYGVTPVTEYKLTCNRIHPENHGIIDVWLYVPQQALLIVIDFKYGHRAVSPAMNKQLINYAATVMEYVGIDGYYDQHTTIDMQIVQPRNFGGGDKIKSWSCVGSDLRTPIRELSEKAHAGMSGQGELRSGSWCLECSARHACSAAGKAAASAFEYSGEPVSNDLSNDALSYEKRLLDAAESAIKARKTGIDAEIEQRIMGGQHVPNYYVENKYGHRAWAVPLEFVKELGVNFGAELTEEKPVTPAEAERRFKQAGAEVDQSIIDAYVSRPSAGVKVVYDDGKKAKQQFSKNGRRQ